MIDTILEVEMDILCVSVSSVKMCKEGLELSFDSVPGWLILGRVVDECEFEESSRDFSRGD